MSTGCDEFGDHRPDRKHRQCEQRDAPKPGDRKEWPPCLTDAERCERNTAEWHDEPRHFNE